MLKLHINISIFFGRAAANPLHSNINRNVEEKCNIRLYNRFSNLINPSNTVRMLYASHILKRRDSVLPVIRKKILSIKEREIEILESFINKAGGVLKNEVVELH